MLCEGGSALEQVNMGASCGTRPVLSNINRNHGVMPYQSIKSPGAAACDMIRHRSSRGLSLVVCLEVACLPSPGDDSACLLGTRVPSSCAPQVLARWIGFHRLLNVTRASSSESSEVHVLSHAAPVCTPLLILHTLSCAYMKKHWRQVVMCCGMHGRQWREPCRAGVCAQDSQCRRLVARLPLDRHSAARSRRGWRCGATNNHRADGRRACRRGRLPGSLPCRIGCNDDPRPTMARCAAITALRTCSV